MATVTLLDGVVTLLCVRFLGGQHQWGKLQEGGRVAGGSLGPDAGSGVCLWLHQRGVVGGGWCMKAGDKPASTVGW